jgi:hypothetical protein
MPETGSAAFDAALTRALSGIASVHALDPAAAGWLAAHLPATRVVTGFERADVAFGLAALDGLDAPAANALLFRARTWLAPCVVVAVPPACALAEDALRALAFETFAQAGEAALWQFNLATYKPAPDWLNARFWANPERWET